MQLSLLKKTEHKESNFFLCNNVSLKSYQLGMGTQHQNDFAKNFFRPISYYAYFRVSASIFSGFRIILQYLPWLQNDVK